MKEKLFLLCVVVFMSLSLSAQTNNTGAFTIKGQVVDSLTNETVPYATLRIVLADAPQQPAKLLACDDNGKFETTLSAAGQYILYSQSVGKISSPKPFTLDESVRQVDLGKLYMADDTQNLGEVTVTAQRPLVKIEIDKISYSLEDDPESKTNNTLDMLRKVPMVTVDGEDNIQLKGSSNYKIYMNGKPSNLLSNNPSDVLKSMPASSVKNIEVITDPGVRYDAEGVGGIINIITTSNTMQGYTGTVRAGASTMGMANGSVYLSAKVGKLGLTGMYNYNYNNMPWSSTEEERVNLINNREKYLFQNGRSRYSGPFQFGNLDISYEIDTLNLINVGARLFRGDVSQKSELHAEMYDSIMGPVYNYNRNSTYRESFGSLDMNVDYQHSTRKKGELLTVSYRFSHAPDGGETYTDLYDVVNYWPYTIYPEKTLNDARTDEHTGQVDYTTPLFKDHTLEAGVKYIFRRSGSDVERSSFIDSLNIWEDTSGKDSKFQHTQHIYSGYLGYALKLAKFSLKAGVRAEGTALDVKYERAPEMNFTNDYFDVVPNATVSYQVSMASQMRLGYNMRIQRPGIWYLNPYVNNVDPQNIYYGNPNLDSEKSNSVNFNYSMFTQKFNLNASLSYTFVNNSIQRYTFIDPSQPGIAQSTYGNIGHQQTTGVFLYGSWNPMSWFRFTLNGGINYVDITSLELNMRNHGWNGNVFGDMQFTLPKDFRINLNGGYYSPRVMLQGKYSDMYFGAFSLSKDFLKKKLTVQLTLREPFRKEQSFETKFTDPAFISNTTSYRPARALFVNVSYRFGTLKEQIKKIQRGITNDDVMSGGSGSGGSGGGQGGGQ